MVEVAELRRPASKRPRATEFPVGQDAAAQGQDHTKVCSGTVLTA